MQSTTRMAGSSDQIAAFWRVIREETRERSRHQTESSCSRHAESRTEQWGNQSREG